MAKTKKRDEKSDKSEDIKEVQRATMEEGVENANADAEREADAETPIPADGTTVDASKAELDGIYADMLKNANEFNAAARSNNLVLTVKLTDIAGELEKRYVVVKTSIVFRELVDDADPMMAAIKMHHFPVMRHKDVKDEMGLVTRSVEEVMRQIDLAKLCKFAADRGKEIAKNPGWLFLAQKVNQLLTARQAVDLGINPKVIYDSFYMSETAKKLDMGQTPASNTAILKLMQTVLDGLHDGLKANSHDVNYLVALYGKKGKGALTVACSNHANFRNLIGDVAYRAANGLTYGVEFKAVEAKK